MVQLQELAPDAQFSDEQLELLVHGRYRATLETDIEALLQSCERWMRALPRRKNHVPA